LKRDILIGIDVGGTHTDGVAINRHSGRILHKVKVATIDDLRKCTELALDELIEVVGTASIARVVLSTTLVTNSVVTGMLEPVGMMVMAGPGLDPRLMSNDPHFKLIRGAMDHRGREIVPIDEVEVESFLQSLMIKGVSVVAVAGKFAVRNPAHENRVADIADRTCEYVCRAHLLSGALNFPRRAATALLAAGTWRKHRNFIDSVTATMENLHLDAPLFLLRADGGAQTAASFQNAAEAALSGPAASIMGISAMDDGVCETIGLDVGGTTTDVCLYVSGAPLIEPHGATIGEYRTQIRSLYTRSLPIGGDSVLSVADGAIKIGPKRKGPAAAYGGPAPTPTDALVALGRAMGDRVKARAALSVPAAELGVSVERFSMMVLNTFGRNLAKVANEFIEEVNARPVYTIHELLQGHKVNPCRVVMVGGPALALSPYVESEMGLPVEVPPHFDVANAVGAAVASLNLEVNAVADTAEGRLSIPEANVFKAIPKGYTLEQTRAEALAGLATLTKAMDTDEREYKTDIAEEESFKIIEGYSEAGSVHRIKLQIRPSILCRVD